MIQPNDPRCGHPTKNGGTCKQLAGAGTEHVGTGVCFTHGGKLRDAGDLDEASARAAVKCGRWDPSNNLACKNTAGFGTDHVGYGRCKYHSGTGQKASSEAAFQRSRVLATVAIGRMGIVDPSRTAETILMDEVHRSDGMVRWIQDQIESIPVDADGKVEVLAFDEVLQDWKVIHTPVLDALASHPVMKGIMEMYRAERDRLHKVAKDAVALGLAQRSLALDEQRVDAMNNFIERLIVDLGHDPNDNGVREVVQGALLQLTAKSA